MHGHSDSVIQQSFDSESTLYPAIPSSYKSERLILPGEGEQYEECGTTKMVISCSNPECEYPVELKPHRCNRPECPVCWPDTLKRATRRAVEKIENALRLGCQCENPHLKTSSIVVSPDQDRLWDYDSLHRWLASTWRKLGVVGLSKVFHPWRFYDAESGEELESVRWRQFEEHPGRYVRKWSPHFHCVVIGKPIDSNRFYERTGAVYKKLNVDFKGNHIELQHHDLFNIVYYALSHAAVSLDRQRKMVDHYGLIRRAFIESETKDYEPDMCELCGCQKQVTYLYDRIALGENVNGLTEPHFKVIITRTWALRPKRPRKSLSHLKGQGHGERECEHQGACV
jgi:hypothetical protein